MKGGQVRQVVRNCGAGMKGLGKRKKRVVGKRVTRVMGKGRRVTKDRKETKVMGVDGSPLPLAIHQTFHQSSHTVPHTITFPRPIHMSLQLSTSYWVPYSYIT